MGNTLGAPSVSSRVRLILARNFQRKSYNPIFWWVDRGSIWTSFSPQILSESGVSYNFFHS